MAPMSVVAVMAWPDEALCGALTVVLPTRAYPVPRAYSSKRPPRYLARKRSAAA